VGRELRDTSCRAVFRCLYAAVTANLLNISRLHLVSLLEKGELLFRKVGAHRRVLAKDVLEYKTKVSGLRQAALDELTALSQEHGMGYKN
jgi:excisionase family DNA binding protein